MSFWVRPIPLFLLAAACTLGGSSGSSTDVSAGLAELRSPDMPSGMSSGLVTWIDDGDTIEVETASGELRLRLLGINAPERGECFAEESLDFLIDEIKGRSIQFNDFGTDQFGRTLADVWFDGRWVNGELMISGMTTAVTSYEEHRNSDLLLEAENRAYAEGRGLWGRDACGARDPAPAIAFDPEQSNFNPPGPDDDVLDDEYIVIVNEGSDPVDMSGWTLRDESSRNRLKFDEGASIAGGGSVRVISGCSDGPSWCGGSSIWNNDGDLALLLDEYGRVVARLRY